MLTPKFSIVLPIYKVEDYIEKCIKSVIKQSYEDFELICVDDASPDNSIELLKKYASNDDRIKIITHDTNKGLGAARNTAIQNAKGEYICCIDSDDWIEQDYLLKVEQAFKNNDVDSVWVKYWYYIEEKDYALQQKGFPYFSHRPEGLLKINPENIYRFPAFAWNKVYRLKHIKNNYFKWLENVYFEDIYFYYDYYMNYPNVYLINEMLYYYRQRSSSIVGRQDIVMQKVKDMFKVHNEIYKLIGLKSLDENYKNAILNSADLYYQQYKKEKCHLLVKMVYDTFLKNLPK